MTLFVATKKPIFINLSNKQMIKLTNETLNNKYSNTSYSNLNLHQRIVLNNGGCLTKLLEDLLEEDLYLCKLKEEIYQSAEDDEVMQVKKGQRVIDRKILLTGSESELNHLYAESKIILDNLEQNFKDLLLYSNVPIGKIWEQLKVETYKTLFAWGDEEAGFNAVHFNLAPSDILLYRTYLVYSNGRPVMRITEKFPLNRSFQPVTKRITA